MANRVSLLRQEAARRAAAADNDYWSDDDDDVDDGNVPFASNPRQVGLQQQQQQQYNQNQNTNQNNSATLQTPRHPLDASLQAQSQSQSHAQHSFASPPPASLNNGLLAAASARKEWKQHGSGVTQALEDKRQHRSNTSSNSNQQQGQQQQQQQQWTVRVVSAQKRIDLVGSNYTAYVVKVAQQSTTTTSMSSSSPSLSERLIEHRYSDFAKLNACVRKHGVTLQHPNSGGGIACSFPGKNLAGRVGNWTPSLTWAPERHSELVQYRMVQLDVWLVHLIDLYNNNNNNNNGTALPVQVRDAVYEFLTCAADKRPCDQVNDATTEPWKWNNPFSFTLGASIRQATHTVNYMCHNVLTAREQSIPLDLLQAAKGLCFMTVFKAGLVVSGRAGTGLVIARLPNDTWSAPCALGTVGMGWGALVGGDVTHYLVVLTTESAVQDFVASSSVQLGAELGVAVGPIGRGANSHVSTGDWTLHPAYAYAHSQGLFVGMSLEGSVVTVRNDVNAKFYGRACDASDLLLQQGPTAADPLYAVLHKAMQMEIPDDSFRPSHLWSPQANFVPTPRAGTSEVSNSSNSFYNINSRTDHHQHDAGPVVTIDTMYQGPAALFDGTTTATPSTVMHANGHCAANSNTRQNSNY